MGAKQKRVSLGGVEHELGKQQLIYTGARDTMQKVKRRGWVRDDRWRKIHLKNVRVRKMGAGELYSLHGTLQRAKRRTPSWKRKGRSVQSKVPLGHPLQRIRSKPKSVGKKCPECGGEMYSFGVDSFGVEAWRCSKCKKGHLQRPLTPEMERFMSPDELAERIRRELLEKGFILRVGSVGYWVIREKERDHDGSGAVVYHPWLTVNYYGKQKWAVFPENRSAEAKFYDARTDAMAAAFKIVSQLKEQR